MKTWSLKTEDDDESGPHSAESILQMLRDGHLDPENSYLSPDPEKEPFKPLSGFIAELEAPPTPTLALKDYDRKLGKENLEISSDGYICDPIEAIKLLHSTNAKRAEPKPSDVRKGKAIRMLLYMLKLSVATYLLAKVMLFADRATVFLIGTAIAAALIATASALIKRSLMIRIMLLVIFGAYYFKVYVGTHLFLFAGHTISEIQTPRDFSFESDEAGLTARAIENNMLETIRNKNIDYKKDPLAMHWLYVRTLYNPKIALIPIATAAGNPLQWRKALHRETRNQADDYKRGLVILFLVSCGITILVYLKGDKRSLYMSLIASFYMFGETSRENLIQDNFIAYFGFFLFMIPTMTYLTFKLMIEHSLKQA